MTATCFLVPDPRIWLRATAVGLLALLAWIGTTPWETKAFFCIGMLACFGSFPRFRFCSEFFERTWFVCFVPVHSRRTLFEKATQIETDVDEHMDAVTSIFWFGVVDSVYLWLIDRLFPWFGGDFKLWLRMGNNERVLLWQGNGERNFRQNVSVLQKVTGLPVSRG
jgi:hypothetical protein